jgi:hypothetical protein
MGFNSGLKGLNFLSAARSVKSKVMNAILDALYGSLILYTLQVWVHSEVINALKGVSTYKFFVLNSNWNLNPSLTEV